MSSAIASTMVSSVGPMALTLLQFNKVKMCVGEVKSIVTNPSAKVPAYLLTLNLGNSLLKEHTKLHKKQMYSSSAQLCTHHKAEEINNQFLLCVLNFPRKQIGKVMSDCLTTGVQSQSGTYEEKRETTVFIKPSSIVEAGSKVGLFAESEVFATNPRDLSWDEFTALDLRICTILTCENQTDAKADAIRKVVMQIELGTLGKQIAVGFLDPTVSSNSLLQKQVLVLINLDRNEIKNKFSDSNATAVLFTVGGGVAILEPAKAVEKWYKKA